MPPCLHRNTIHFRPIEGTSFKTIKENIALEYLSLFLSETKSSIEFS